MKKGVKVKREATFKESLFPLIAMLVVIIIGKGVLGYNISAVLLVATAISVIIPIRCGYSWDDILKEIVSKISDGMGPILLLIIVGTLIGSWMASGTIPMIIYFGVQIISPKLLLVTAFILTAIVSVCTGSSWSSVSTVGIAIMGIAVALHANMPAVAGAVVAGSYFGDKMSPMSDTTNLAPIAAGSELYPHIKHMFWTTIPITIISLIIYTIVGLTTKVDTQATSETVLQMTSQLDSMFSWNILLLLPLIIILVGSIKKKPSIPTMVISSFVALVLALIFQGTSLKNGMASLVTGYDISMVTNPNFDTSSVMPEIAKLLNRGGMQNMMSTILIILIAFSYAGVMATSGCLNVLLKALTKHVKSDGSLVLSTVISTWIMALTTGSVHVTILLPGEMFRSAYKDRNLDAVNLSRTLEDAGTVVVPIIPWSSSGLYMTACLGVATLSYLPWAILCYGCSLLAIVYGFTGIGIKRLKKEEIEK